MKIQHLLAAAALSVSATANAMVIDFTDRDYWDKNGTITENIYGDLAVTVSAWDKNGNSTSYNTREGYGLNGNGTEKFPCESDGGFLACESDGLGIGDDEISFGEGGKTDVERIRISFSHAVDIESLIFLDLFAGGANNSDPVSEVAQAHSNNGGMTWTGTAMDNIGFMVGTADNGNLSSNIFDQVFWIDIFADTAKASSPYNTDFALAGITLKGANVPEPGSLALLVLGLLGLGFARKRV